MPTTPWLATTQQTVTQGFGVCELAGDCPHTGIDVAAASGTPIIDQIAGVVRDLVGGGFGSHQIIDIGGGRDILLGHESAFAVPSGAQVRPGQVLGYVGSTGFSTGPHLHFQYDVAGKPVDPSSLLFGMGGPGVVTPLGTLPLPTSLPDPSAAIGAGVQAAGQAIGAGITGAVTSTGHGLVNALTASIHNLGVFATTQAVALFVAAVVVLVVFMS